MMELDEWVDEQLEMAMDRALAARFADDVIEEDLQMERYERLERFETAVSRLCNNWRDPRDPAREDRRMDAAAWEEWFGRDESEWTER